MKYFNLSINRKKELVARAYDDKHIDETVNECLSFTKEIGESVWLYTHEVCFLVTPEMTRQDVVMAFFEKQKERLNNQKKFEVEKNEVDDNFLFRDKEKIFDNLKNIKPINLRDFNEEEFYDWNEEILTAIAKSGEVHFTDEEVQKYQEFLRNAGLLNYEELEKIFPEIKEMGEKTVDELLDEKVERKDLIPLCFIAPLVDLSEKSFRFRLSKFTEGCEKYNWSRICLNNFIKYRKKDKEVEMSK